MITRRKFLTRAAVAAVAASSIGFPAVPAGRSSRPLLKVGLVGCGGRGTGAAAQTVNGDPNVVLTAMGDVFADRLQSSLQSLQEKGGDKIQVPPEKRFVGLDAFQRVIESGVDVVILATPPAFRPEHLRAAVVAGKHVFSEKPMAVDGPGVRSILESAEQAKQKNLALVAGYVYRYDDELREMVKRVHSGDVGEIRAVHSLRYGNSLSTKFPGNREPGWTDLEWQLRNWYFFNWLSGDHLVEQAVHSVDKIAWIMADEMPVRVTATGGRQVPAYGDIYDHFQINYEYANGARTFLNCRQQDHCHRENSDYVMGESGFVMNGRGPFAQITGKTTWRYTGQKRNMFQTSHDEMYASIRSGRPINDGIWMAHSTMMAIMGRMAAYTGQMITWEQALNSRESLVPEKLDWNMTLTVPPIPQPGVTRFT